MCETFGASYKGQKVKIEKGTKVGSKIIASDLDPSLIEIIKTSKYHAPANHCFSNLA